MLRGTATARVRWFGVLLVAATGAIGAGLVLLGNPGNMGLCGACFLRDLAGALRLHNGPAIFRPELAGLMLGALLAALASRRHVGRSGSHAVVRLLLCVLMAFGALVFLGCPFRMLQRLGGGDLWAWAALPGFIVGVQIAAWFERRGYSLGKTQEVPMAIGLIGPLSMVGLSALFVSGRLAGPGPDGDGGPPHVVWWVAAALALPAGAMLSATGFCAISAARQIGAGPRWMLLAAGALVLAYAAVLLLAGRAPAALPPVAHGDWLWNTLALMLVGLTGAFAGGCPVRQVIMAGEGNGDAFVGVVGLVLGGALAHACGIASSPATGVGAGGPTVAGQLTVALAVPAVLAFAAAMVRSARPAAAG